MVEHLKKVEILNIELDNYTKKELLTDLQGSIKMRTKKFLVTANPEIVMMANHNPTFQRAIQSADYVIADGIGLIMGSKILGYPLEERIPGVELMEELLKVADKNCYGVYFYGSKPEVLKKLLAIVEEKYPGIVVVGSSDGYSTSSEAVAEQVELHTPDIVFVALGAPKQEAWIFEHYQRYSNGLFIGVGGSFDVLSGSLKRAPQIWRRLNLEWLYRLLKQPSRWKRYMLLPKYLIKVFKSKYRNKPHNG